MAKVTKCDRCGEFYEPEYMTGLEAFVDSLKPKSIGEQIATTVSYNYDLCSDCRESLIKWVQEGKNERTS